MGKSPKAPLLHLECSIGPAPGYRHMAMTTASPPRLSMNPVRFAFRCRITPASFCSQRSPPLAVPPRKAVAGLALGAGELPEVAPVVDLARRLDGREAVEA